jgi:hypothetical protein
MQLAVRERLTLDEATERVASYHEHLPRLAADAAAPAPAAAQAAAPAMTIAASDDVDAEERRLMWWQRD